MAFAGAKIIHPPGTRSPVLSDPSLIPFPRINPDLPPPSISLASQRRLSGSAVLKETKTKSTTNLLLTTEEGLEVYEDMILGRTFEDMCAQMYYRGKMFGFVHLYNGQEAVSSGFIKLLKKEDSVVSTYRDHVHALSQLVQS